MNGGLPADAYHTMTRLLATPLLSLKGVGPKVFERLSRKGLKTLGDALTFLPLRYEDRTRLLPLAELTPGGTATFRGTLTRLEVRDYSRRKVLEGTLSDASGTLSLKWFRGNFGWLQSRLPVGASLVGSGPVQLFLGRREVVHPELETLEEGEEASAFERVVPVYSDVEGVNPKGVRRILEAALERAAPAVVDLVPGHLAAGLGVASLAEAYRELHFPTRGGEGLERRVEGYRRSVVLEEFFLLQLGLLLKKSGAGPRSGIPFRPHFRLVKALLKSLPFEITPAQRRVLGEIRRDMESPCPMHRLLQGDVGSGKTLVALVSALMAVECGYQAAVMAPTEILAEQHGANLARLCAALPVRTAALTGSTPKGEREQVLRAMASGEVELVVGTHALLQEGVEFAKLGLVVVDEQHRFGVLHRAGLVRKGAGVDLLVMTATPIPRSLSMTLYGDLDLSVIDELPPGRRPIVTRVARERDRQRVYEFARTELAKGRQAYVVYPLVEESEKLDLLAATTMAEHLARDVFPEFRLGLLHGRLRADEKERVMAAFSAGELDVLVATTVIEVGIDVANATLMVIEHAERFGLAQLHQLRGRVGRGGHASHCVVLAGERLSKDGWERLQILARSHDGFRIAEEDLRIRGPGDFLGTRQSGLPDFRVGNILRDGALLQTARDLAQTVLDDDPGLAGGKYPALREALLDRWAGRLELSQAG